jgi:hypothetical protein
MISYREYNIPHTLAYTVHAAPKKYKMMTTSQLILISSFWSISLSVV